MSYFDVRCPLCGMAFNSSALDAHTADRHGGDPQPKSPDPVVPVLPLSESRPLRSLMATGHEVTFGTGKRMSASAGNEVRPNPKSLRQAVAEQLEALTDGLEAAPDELPEPPRDLTTYRDAFASAAKACRHENATELLYQREWLCEDCGRVLGPRDMRERRWWS